MGDIIKIYQNIAITLSIPVNWSHLFVIDCINVCTTFDQKLNHIQLSADSSEVKRCCFRVCRHTNVRSDGHQCPYCVDVTCLKCVSVE